MSGTRQGTHERSSLSDVQSKSNEDQKTGTDLRTCPPASDERERYGGVDRLPVLLLVEVKKSSIRTSKKKKNIQGRRRPVFVFSFSQLGRNCSRGKPDFRASLVPGKANFAVEAWVRREIHRFRSKQSANVRFSHGTPSDVNRVSSSHRNQTRVITLISSSLLAPAPCQRAAIPI